MEHSTNLERTEQYLKRFNRETTLKYLIQKPNPIIFDVGANVGTSLEEFKSWWPDSKVYCFEPQKECWSALRRLVGKYSANSIEIIESAVGNVSEDSGLFYSHDIHSGLSGFHKINLESVDSVQLEKIRSVGSGMAEYEKSLNKERKVKVLRLDHFMASRDIAHLDLVKIDTQGYEPEVLQGFAERLMDVDVVITELMFYDYYERSLSFSDIEQFLHPAGFHLHDISHIAKNPMNGRTDWVDVIYVNDRLSSDL